jgi:hypothetical protein
LQHWQLKTHCPLVPWRPVCFEQRQKQIVGIASDRDRLAVIVANDPSSGDERLRDTLHGAPSRFRFERVGRDFLRLIPAETGNVTAAVTVAGTSRTRVYELRKIDPAFAAEALEASGTGGIEIWVCSRGGVVRGPNGEQMTREEAEARARFTGSFIYFASETDARL